MIRKIAVVYTTATGEILREVQCTEEQFAAQYNSSVESLLQVDEHVDEGLYYISGGVLTARSVLGTSLDKSNIDADGVDKATISSVPSGTDVFVNFEYFEQCDDGTVEISSDEADRIFVELYNFPYQKQEYTIYAS